MKILKKIKWIFFELIDIFTYFAHLEGQRYTKRYSQYDFTKDLNYEQNIKTCH